MNEKQPRQRSVTRAEFERLEAETAETRRITKETHDMIRAIHDPLIKPSPGQTKGLLDRMASVTISVESGERVSVMLIRGAGVLAAIGALWAALTAFWPK